MASYIVASNSFRVIDRMSEGLGDDFVGAITSTDVLEAVRRNPTTIVITDWLLRDVTADLLLFLLNTEIKVRTIVYAVQALDSVLVCRAYASGAMDIIRGYNPHLLQRSIQHIKSSEFIQLPFTYRYLASSVDNELSLSPIRPKPGSALSCIVFMGSERMLSFCQALSYLPTVSTLCLYVEPTHCFSTMEKIRTEICSFSPWQLSKKGEFKGLGVTFSSFEEATFADAELQLLFVLHGELSHANQRHLKTIRNVTIYDASPSGYVSLQDNAREAPITVQHFWTHTIPQQLNAHESVRRLYHHK